MKRTQQRLHKLQHRQWAGTVVAYANKVKAKQYPVSLLSNLRPRKSVAGSVANTEQRQENAAECSSTTMAHRDTGAGKTCQVC